MSTHAHRQSILKTVLAASIVSTAIHYTHNYVAVDQYPRSDLISTGGLRTGIVVLWPLLTAIGLLGYRLYAQRRYRPAHICLAIYSSTGISTLGHFLDGSPDIPLLFYATLFSDGLLGFAVLGFALWSVGQTRVDTAASRAVQ